MLRVAGLGQRERRELSWASWRTERCWMRRKALAKKLSVSPKLWASKQSTWRVSESVGSRRETREVQVKVGRKPRLASPFSPLACRSTWSTCVPLDNHLDQPASPPQSSAISVSDGSFPSSRAPASDSRLPRPGPRHRVQVVRRVHSCWRCNVSPLPHFDLVILPRAAELLNAIPMASRPPRSTLSFPTHLHPFHSSTPTRPFHSPSGGGRGGGPRPSLSTMSPSDFVPQPAPSIPPPLEEEVDWGEEDTYELGRAYFEAKELERAAWALRGCRSNKAVFLSLYAQYLVSRQPGPHLTRDMSIGRWADYASSARSVLGIRAQTSECRRAFPMSLVRPMTSMRNQ
jgi:hypothetical protein